MGLDDPLDEEVMKIAQSVRNNNPGLLAEMTSQSGVGSKQYLRERFGSAQAVDNIGVTGWKAVSFGPEAERLIGRLCTWFGQTGFFKHTGAIFRGEVLSTRLYSEHVQLEAVERLLQNFVGQPVLIRNGKDLSGQFFYRFFAADGIFVSFMQFTRRPQFVFVVCAFAESQMTAEMGIPSFWHRSGIVGHQPISPR